MPDTATVKNTIRKRVPQLIHHGCLDEGLVVNTFRDSVGIAVAVDVDGVAYPMTFKLPIGFARRDVLNVVDGIHETMRRIRRDRPSVAEYMAGKKLPREGVSP